MSSVTFEVRGLPAPQGSKRAIVNRYTRKAALIESSKRVKPWRADVRQAATDAMLAAWSHRFARNPPPLRGPVHVDLEFGLPRPKGHYGTGRNADQLKPSASEWPAGKPDIDKLARAVLDAITDIIVTDDAQVVQIEAAKRYVVAPRLPGVIVTVTELA